MDNFSLTEAPGCLISVIAGCPYLFTFYHLLRCSSSFYMCHQLESLGRTQVSKEKINIKFSLVKAVIVIFLPPPIDSQTLSGLHMYLGMN